MHEKKGWEFLDFGAPDGSFVAFDDRKEKGPKPAESVRQSEKGEKWDRGVAVVASWKEKTLFHPTKGRSYEKNKK